MVNAAANVSMGISRRLFRIWEKYLNLVLLLSNDESQCLQIYNRRLPHSKENVCMAVSKPKILYAVGSQSHVNLVDPRSKNTLTTIISKYRGGGKCSLGLN